MSGALLPPLVYASAPGFACRVGAIVTRLAAVVASHFRNPRIAPITVALCTRLNRLAGRFERLMLRLAAGIPTRPHRSGPGGPRPATSFPTGRAWLVRAVGYEAAAYRSQLEALLAEPAVAELLAACPAAVRILRPLARMLGVDAPALPQLPATPRAPRRPAPPDATPPEATPPSAEAPPADPPADPPCLALPPEPQPPPNAPAWLRERRPSIILPFPSLARPREKPT